MVTQWSNVMKRRQLLPRGIPRYHDAETHHAKPQDTTKGTAGYPYTTGTQKAAKISNKNFSFTWVHSLHAELTNASHSTNLSAHSCDHVPPMAKLSTLLYKPATPHNFSIRSNEGLTLETSAF